MSRKAGWAGTIRVKDLNTGEVQTIQNAILDAGLTMTAEKWIGTSTETFAELQIENTDGTSTAKKSISASQALNSGTVTVTSTASFTSTDVSFDVATVALLGSNGTRIAEAAVTISSGSAVEITREDSLTETA